MSYVPLKSTGIPKRKPRKSTTNHRTPSKIDAERWAANARVTKSLLQTIATVCAPTAPSEKRGYGIAWSSFRLI